MIPWATVLLIILAMAVLYGVLLAAEAFHRYRPAQIVRCPTTGKPVRVQLDATIAALTAVPGPSKLIVEHCELWPPRHDCGQRCTKSLS